jgi:hypothetical protein
MRDTTPRATSRPMVIESPEIEANEDTATMIGHEDGHAVGRTAVRALPALRH